MTRFSFLNLLIACSMIGLLVPSTLTIFGVTFFDLSLTAFLTFTVAQRMASGVSTGFRKGVEQWLLLFFLLSLITYILNSGGSFADQKQFVESLQMKTDFLFIRLTLYGVFTLGSLLLLYKSISSLRLSCDDVEKVVTAIVYTGSLNAVVTNCYWIIKTGGNFGRYNYLPPLEQSQGIHTFYMSVTFLLALALWLVSTVPKQKRVVLLACMAVTGFSLVTVMSRQAWIMFVLSLLVYLLFMWRSLSRRIKRRVSLLMMGILGAGVVVVVFMYGGDAQQYFSEVVGGSTRDDTHGSVMMRFVLLRQAVSIFTDHLIIGVGYGHYPAYSTMPLLVSGAERFVSSPHNGILTLAAETGIIGLICCGGIFFYLTRETLDARRMALTAMERSVASATASLLLIALVSQVISNSMIIPLPTERSMTQSAFLLWFLIAMAGSIRRSATLASGRSS